MDEEQYLDATKNQIRYWRNKGSRRYSTNELYAHALYVISTARIKNYQELATRLITLYQMSLLPPKISRFVRSTFTIYTMQLNLCRGYYMHSSGAGKSLFICISF